MLKASLSPMTQQSDFIKTLSGQKTEKPPIWLMRQAGRYLPEYRELRASVPNFMTAVLTPDIAHEITMQPMRRFDKLDAAILFSDILVIPYALGQKVEFIKGEGPQLPALADRDIALEYDGAKLAPILETVSHLRRDLPQDKTLIGFAGAPWTVACYMIAGRNHDEFTIARQWAFAQPERLDALLETVTQATIQYLLAQIKAGANVVQIFESWAALLSGHKREFERFILQPTQKIIAAIRAQYPGFPIIGFPRAAASYLPWYARETGIDAVGIDWSTDPEWANRELPQGFPVQGNLDPLLLLSGGNAMLQSAREIKTIFAQRPLIFNLGHGVIQFTPPEHVGQLLDVVKE